MKSFAIAAALTLTASSAFADDHMAPMVEAMRGVTLQAKGITDFPRELAIIGAWLVGTSLVAVKVFRFQ